MLEAARPVTVPRLATERLLLRELRMSDFDGFAANLGDPIATQFISGVSDRRNAWRIFAAATGAWMLQGAGWWSVEHIESGEVVGTVGAFFRDASPDLELGWSLYRRFWGRGFAKEAAAGALAWGIATCAPARVVAHVDPRNVASVRVGERLGMRYECEVDFYGERIDRYLLEPAADGGS